MQSDKCFNTCHRQYFFSLHFLFLFLFLLLLLLSLLVYYYYFLSSRFVLPTTKDAGAHSRCIFADRGEKEAESATSLIEETLTVKLFFLGMEKEGNREYNTPLIRLKRQNRHPPCMFVPFKVSKGEREREREKKKRRRREKVEVLRQLHVGFVSIGCTILFFFFLFFLLGEKTIQFLVLREVWN